MTYRELLMLVDVLNGYQEIIAEGRSDMFGEYWGDNDHTRKALRCLHYFQRAGIELTTGQTSFMSTYRDQQ